MSERRSSTREELLTHPEGKTLEFKRDLSSPKPLLKTLVAFANTAGGRLFVGIDDDRSIGGVENPLNEEERLCNLIADSIAPRLVPNVELLTVEGKRLLLPGHSLARHDGGRHAPGCVEDPQPRHRPCVPRTQPDRAVGQRGTADFP